jgi:hypothetical protein
MLTYSYSHAGHTNACPFTSAACPENRIKGLMRFRLDAAVL